MNYGLQIAQTIYNALGPVGYVICIAALVFSFKDREDAWQIIWSIVRVIIAVVFIANFQSFMHYGDQAVQGVTSDVSNQVDQLYTQIWSVDQNQGTGIWDWIKSLELTVSHILQALFYWVAKLFIGIGFIGRYGMNILRDFLMLVLYAFSPLFVACLAFKNMQRWGIQYVATTMGIICWPLGYLLADAAIFSFLGQLCSMFAIGSSPSAIVAAFQAGAAGASGGAVTIIVLAVVALAIGLGTVVLYVSAALGISYLFSSGGIDVGNAASGITGAANALGSAASGAVSGASNAAKQAAGAEGAAKAAETQAAATGALSQAAGAMSQAAAAMSGGANATPAQAEMNPQGSSSTGSGAASGAGAESAAATSSAGVSGAAEAGSNASGWAGSGGSSGGSSQPISAIAAQNPVIDSNQAKMDIDAASLND